MGVTDREERQRPYWDPEPWPEVVSGSAVLDRVNALFGRYVTTGEEETTALTLWTARTWFPDAYDFAAGLVITSPEKQCGKTRTMEVAARMSFRPIMTMDASMPVLYRAVDEDGATIFLDEVDRIKNRERREDLTRILNGSTSRSFGWVERCETVGRKITRRSFRVFGPKAVAAIGADSAPDTFRDRSLHIELQRRPKSEGAKVKLRREEPLFAEVRRQLARWAEDVQEKLGDPPDFDFPLFTSERHEEAWEPLLEIAQVAGGAWPDRAKQALEKLTQPDEDVDSWRVALLRDTYRIYQELGDGSIGRDRLCNALNLMDEPSRPWATWGKEDAGLSANQMRKVLKDYGPTTQEVWDDGKKTRGYRWDDFFDAWERYGVAGG